MKILSKVLLPSERIKSLSNKKPQKKNRVKHKGNAMKLWNNVLEISEQNWEVAFFLNSHYDMLTQLHWPAGFHWNHLTDVNQ